VLSLKQPSASLLFGLAEPHGAVYPKEVVEAAGEGPLKEYTGTGPYRFIEHRPDRHLKLARFKDYVARNEPASGFGGKRVAYVDEILFMPVADTAGRLAGVETGEYHHGMFVKQDSYERIKSLLQLQEAVEAPRVWTQGQELEVEAAVGEDVHAGLAARGHHVVPVAHVAGGMGAIAFEADGTFTGASCWRAADGTPVGLGGGYARPGIRFWPDRRTPPSPA